jgi:hypothetical protein
MLADIEGVECCDVRPKGWRTAIVPTAQRRRYAPIRDRVSYPSPAGFTESNGGGRAEALGSGNRCRDLRATPAS